MSLREWPTVDKRSSVLLLVISNYDILANETNGQNWLFLRSDSIWLL